MVNGFKYSISCSVIFAGQLCDVSGDELPTQMHAMIVSCFRIWYFNFLCSFISLATDLYEFNSVKRHCWVENIIDPSSAWTAEGKFYRICGNSFVSLFISLCFLFQRQHLYKNDKYPHILNVETNTTSILQQEALSEGKLDSNDMEGL